MVKRGCEMMQGMSDNAEILWHAHVEFREIDKSGVVCGTQGQFPVISQGISVCYLSLCGSTGGCHKKTPLLREAEVRH